MTALGVREEAMVLLRHKVLRCDATNSRRADTSCASLEVAPRN
jgi:hypothetical protein